VTPGTANGRHRLIVPVALVAVAVAAGAFTLAGRGPAAGAPAPPSGERTAQAPPAPSSPAPDEPVAMTPAPAEPVAASPAPAGEHPERLRIPAIGVDAPVIDLGLNDDGTLEVPSDFDETGWWSGGPMPGALGPAVIAGHVDSRSGPAVFFHLDELSAGDEIVVDGSGGTVTFTVEHLEQHPKDDFPTDLVYHGDEDRPALRLITCGGTFDRSTGHYRDNIIVFAGLASTD
jgi:LPXTG-site transpeptidase (sortase) family protein